MVESWGLRPESVAGHSIGEITAAHVAGVLSLEDACTLVSARARLMQALPVGGVMVAVQATEDEVAPLLTDGVSIAAINGADSVVLAGDEDAVTAVVAAFEGRKTSKLSVSHAFHSPLMDPMLEEFRSAIAELTFSQPRFALVSNLTGEAVSEVDAPTTGCGTSVRPCGSPTASPPWRARVGSVLELGPDGVLSAMTGQLAPDLVAVPALRKDRGEEIAILSALGRLHVTGTTVDWRTLLRGTARRAAHLPVPARAVLGRELVRHGAACRCAGPR